MQPSKSVSSANTSAPLASGCTSCATVTLPRGSRTIAGMPAAAAYAASDADVSPVDAQRDGANLLPVGHHLPDHRDEHRHPEVLERSGVRVAAQLHPHLLDARCPRPKRSAQEQVRAALVHRDDVVVADLGAHPLLLAPDARAVRPRRALVALVEQPHPRRGAAIAQAPRGRATPRAGRRRPDSDR